MRIGQRAAERAGTRGVRRAAKGGARALTLVLLGLSAPTTLAASTPASAASPARLEPGTHDLRLGDARGARSYVVHVPPQAARGDALPLLLAFHGGGGQAEGFREYAGLDAVADREGFVVVYPDGSGRVGRRLLTWNAGACCGFAQREGVDDVAFARAVVDDVARRVAVDRTRVYATGHSNGAMMAYRVAAEASDLVAAIAPVGGAMQVEAFAPARPVPVLHIHSVDDPRALYAGGLGPPFPLTRSRVQHKAVEVELQRWVVLDGCPGEPEPIEVRREEKTGHTATHLRYAPCQSGAEVELWKLTGAGHGWPGSEGALSERIIGPETHVISTAEEVWRFVSRFERPARDEGSPPPPPPTQAPPLPRSADQPSFDAAWASASRRNFSLSTAMKSPLPSATTTSPR